MATTRLIPGHVHPQAVINNHALVQIGVTVGARTRVWQFASLIRKAQVGEDCSIAANAVVDGARIGNGTTVSHCVLVPPGTSIGNGVFVGPFVSFCNDTWPRANKEGFDSEALVSGLITTVRIEDGASIGAHAVVLPGIVVGAEAMVAAGAVVTTNVPAAHVYHRDGMIVPIDPRRRPNRMRNV